MSQHKRISNFAQLTEHLQQCSTKRRIAVVCPNDAHTQYAIDRARDEGVAEFLLFDSEQPDEAARAAVEAVREGQADVLMKGKINTDNLLRAILDKQHGILKPGAVMSHLAIAHIPAIDRLIAFSDAAVIPQPTLDQFDAIVKYHVNIQQQLGVEYPHLALIHCTEKTSEKFPHTLFYKELKQRAVQEQYGSVCIDGPMDVKTALDSESGQIKGISSPVVGHADSLIFPDIQAGNTFYKTITLLANATTAGILCGTTAPVIVTSRADSADSKYYSLALACLYRTQQ